MTEQTTTNDTRPAALDQEYVVGSGFWWFRGNASRGLALPWAIDDITQDFGDDLYDRMELDSQIASCDSGLRAAVLEDGFTLSPAVDEAGADGYDQAVALVDFCEQNLEDVETPLDDTAWDMLGCMGRGNRVAEIVYHPFDASPLPGRAVLQNLMVKPREMTAFVVDPYMRTLGLLGRSLDRPVGVLPGALIDPATTPNLLPREKFMIASFRPHNNDPRGSSIYRPAYNPWNMKMQAWQDYLKYLAQFATPIIVGKTAPGVKDTVDPATGATIRAVDAMLATLLTLHNSAAIAIQGGAEVDLLFSTGEGRAFLNAIALFNEEITKAITTQTLATNEGEHQARAAANVHQDALDTIVRQAKRSACRMLRRDVLRNLVRYNYGDAAAQLTPKVSLGEVQAEDAAKMTTAFAQAGYVIHPSQYSGIDRRLNLPARDLTGDPTPPVVSPPQKGAPAPGATP
jgi:Protein of unknown function (DUF935)